MNTKRASNEASRVELAAVVAAIGQNVVLSRCFYCNLATNFMIGQQTSLINLTNASVRVIWGEVKQSIRVLRVYLSRPS